MAQTNALLRAMFVSEDITQVKDSITKDKCYVVQHFNYGSQRERLTTNMMDTNESPSFVDIVIRIATVGTGKQFYEQMQENEPYTYSILFNASFSATGRLLDYDDAMLVKGYIVDVEEDISTNNLQETKDTQVLMKVRLLLSNITYIGSESNLELNI